MKIIHTAKIKPGNGIELIITASYKKQEIMREAKRWRNKYPGKKVKYETIMEGNQ